MNYLLNILFAVFRPKSSINLQWALIINLAVSDFGFSAVIGFPLKTIAAFNQYWPWGSVGMPRICRMYQKQSFKAEIHGG